MKSKYTEKEKVELISKLYSELGDWYFGQVDKFPKPSFWRGHEATAQANARLVNNMGARLTLFRILMVMIQGNEDGTDECIKSFRNKLL